MGMGFQFEQHRLGFEKNNLLFPIRGILTFAARFAHRYNRPYANHDGNGNGNQNDTKQKV